MLQEKSPSVTTPLVFLQGSEKVVCFDFEKVFGFPMFMAEKNANAKPSARIKISYSCISVVNVSTCNLYRIGKS